MTPGVVTRIFRPRSGPVVVDIDGHEWGRLPRAVVRALAVAEGDIRDPGHLLTEAQELMGRCALERGLRLTAARERSSAEVERALESDGYPPGVVAGATRRLREIGAVDDERFAGALARTLVLARGFGRSRLVRALAASGISDEMAEAAIARACPEEAEAERALSQARALAPRCAGRPDRLAARLVRRGFSPSMAWSTARVALRDDGAASSANLEAPSGDWDADPEP